LNQRLFLVVGVLSVGLILGFSFTVSAEEDYNIPDWIKNNAKWWSEGKVSDSDFVSGMKYLIENNVIEISTTVKASDEYFEKYKDWAKREISKYQDYSKSLKSRIDDLDKELSYTKGELEKWKFYSKELEQSLDRISFEYEKYTEAESLKPKTTIYEQKVMWGVSDSKGNRYNWSMPIESYEDLIRATEPLDTLPLENTKTGEIFTVRDHTKFVRSGFTKVIDQVYDNAGSDSNFVYEVWYIVSQLTTYSYDIGEDPRWALETLSRGGGDCEDTAILIAEMINSSEHTKNWEISLVYFDAHNPKNPKAMNHVAVYIDDGKRNYFIESTAKDDPYAWPDGVKGWYFEI